MEETSSSSNQWKKHFANSSSLKTACHLNHACISSPLSTGGNYTPFPSSKWNCREEMNLWQMPSNKSVETKKEKDNSSRMNEQTTNSSILTQFDFTELGLALTCTRREFVQLHSLTHSIITLTHHHQPIHYNLHHIHLLEPSLLLGSLELKHHIHTLPHWQSFLRTQSS